MKMPGMSSYGHTYTSYCRIHPLNISWSVRHIQNLDTSWSAPSVFASTCSLLRRFRRHAMWVRFQSAHFLDNRVMSDLRAIVHHRLCTGVPGNHDKWTSHLFLPVPRGGGLVHSHSPEKYTKWIQVSCLRQSWKEVSWTWVPHISRVRW